MQREIILLASQTLSASGTGTVIGIPEANSCIIYYNVGTAGGTTETIDMYIQQCFKAAPASTDVVGTVPTGTTYTIFDDYIHFAQTTTAAGIQVARIRVGTGTSASNAPYASFTAAQDAALAVSTVKAGGFGLAWRLKWVIAGTLPTYATTWMTAQFFNS